MSKIIEFFVDKTEVILNFCDRHPWVVPSVLGTGLGAFAINEYANHDAMEHGYDRDVKIGTLDIGVHKPISLPDSSADGGQPLIE